MRIEEFDFDLPRELIAQEPLEHRAASRMMVVERQSAAIKDSSFERFPDLLSRADLVVVNDTKVFPARLIGTTETGAAVEIFLVSEIADGSWEVLAKPGRRLKKGKRIELAEDLVAEVVRKKDDGMIVVSFYADGDLAAIVDRIGKTPLPPYIARDKGKIDADRDRYQTVYARNRGAVAAPTAGLHFTPEIIEQMSAKGVQVARITLHVGYGTFEPIRVADISDHRVAPERYEISDESAKLLNSALDSRGRIVAIGTTTTRALESNINEFGSITAGRHLAGLTITPGYEFRAVNALLTNFHLPKSSLLVLTSVFGGRDLIMKAYRHAVLKSYRFYSYGDCMLIT